MNENKSIEGRFIYHSPNVENSNFGQGQNATLGVKFAQRVRITDPYWIIGGTKWSRTILRLKHPIIYSKRGMRNIYRRIKRFFFGSPPIILYKKKEGKNE